MRHRFLTLFLLTILVSACQEKKIRQQIVGPWAYDLEATRLEMSNREASPSEINYMESILNTLNQARVVFNRDGSMTLAMDGLEETGTWSLQSKGNELIINLTGSDQVNTIEYLSTDTLILYPQRPDADSFPRVLVSVEE